jgi:hypothetical protein
MQWADEEMYARRRVRAREAGEAENENLRSPIFHSARVTQAGARVRVIENDFTLAAKLWSETVAEVSS